MVSTLSTCKKGGLGCANTVYNFEIAGKIYPDKDSIHIGDTVWLELNIPTNFTDITSNQIVDYSGAENLGSAIGFGEYSVINNPAPAANSFLDVLVKGKKVDNPDIAQIREFLFEEQNNRYVFKLGIIPKEKGIFGTGFSNAQNVYRNSDKCTKAFFKINVENTRQHYYLNPNINSSNFDTTKPSGSYYFKVY
jgi:hypothetical protein